MKKGNGRLSEAEGHLDGSAHKCHAKHRHAKQLCFGAGLISLFWFLFRVIPKPSRAAYPCQRVAAPMASGFVLWLVGMFASAFAYHKAKKLLRQSRLPVAAIACAATLVVCVVNVANTPRSASAAYPAFHSPVGTAQGIHPGRVAWVYNPGAVSWDGYTSPEHWYASNHTNQTIVDTMMSQAIRGIAGADIDAEAWDMIFRHFNITHGRGDRGYLPGEKIVIKINNGTCYETNMTTYEKTGPLNRIDPSPQMVTALLRQLVNVAGVNQSDITIGDPVRAYPNHLYNPPHTEFPNVHYLDFYGGMGRTKSELSTTQFQWSPAAADSKKPDYLPVPYAEMDYFINFSVLKGHSSGITVCGKNLYGSLNRNPDGSLSNQPGVGIQDYWDMHLSLPNPGWAPGTGHYRAVVDLMGSDRLGGKTLLCLVDGLFAGYYWESEPRKWLSSPFAANGGWPASLFASQDQVAIDSVAYDFLLNEWPRVVTGGVGAMGELQGGAEDYLHEAALANNPPSGTFYDPEHDGTRMQSLGVHEHWNNATDRQYSRNLGLDSGIELMSLMYDRGAMQRAKLTANSTSANIAGAVVTANFGSFFYIESDDRAMGIRVDSVYPTAVPGKRVNVSGSLATNTHGERVISATSIALAGTGTVAPLGLVCKSVGGGPWQYNQTTGSGQRGVTGGQGQNNIGLLVRASGKYAHLNSTQFTINDGSATVYCFVASGVVLNPAWSHVSVTGISAPIRSGTEYRRSIRIRSQSDIQAY